MAVSEDELRQAVADIVGARAVSRGTIERELTSRDLPAGRRLDEVLRDPTFAQVEAGFVHVPSLVDGTRWSVWIDADDAEDDFVRLKAHLAPLVWWLVVADEVALVDDDGAAVGALATDDLDDEEGGVDVLVGPEGWLAALAGRWATVRVVGGGLSWTVCPTPPAATPDQLAAVRAGYEAAVRAQATARTGPKQPADLPHAVGDDVVYEALVVDRAAFIDAAIPPLPELYEAAGLEAQRSFVAERGFDWERFHVWQDRNRLGLVYELEDAEVDLLVACVGATLAWIENGDGLGTTDDERRGAAVLVAAILDDGDIAEAYWNECLRRGASWRTSSASPRPCRPNSMARRRSGWPGCALAVSNSPATWWAPSNCWNGPSPSTASTNRRCSILPGFAPMPGTGLPGAFALLHRAGVTEPPADDDPYSEADEAELLLEEVGGFALHRPRAAVGRNDRCPCGSGRKYKACHLGRERHPLDDRAGWLYGKAQRFLRRRAADVVDELADEILDPIDHPLRWRELRDSALVADLALHEGGVFADFLDAREALLPDDEALLAAQWVLTDRGVFEVRRIERDRVELHDIGRGETITVVNVTPNEHTHTGTVLSGRPLPVGETYRALGGFVTIPRARVGQLLDAIDERDPVAIAAIIGETLQPADGAP